MQSQLSSDCWGGVGGLLGPPLSSALCLGSAEPFHLPADLCKNNWVFPPCNSKKDH
jgi:hypothetical protein